MAGDASRLSTELLRHGSEPLWARLRELLRQRGVDPERAALATMFSDDTNMEFGIVVTPEQHVYEFDLHYGGGDLRHQAETATITDWRDRTDWWRDTPHRAEVADAIMLLSTELA